MSRARFLKRLIPWKSTGSSSERLLLADGVRKGQRTRRGGRSEGQIGIDETDKAAHQELVEDWLANRLVANSQAMVLSKPRTGLQNALSESQKHRYESSNTFIH
ncbi:UNVERIFIED_CONTAM: hypothetical protein K2H54_023540 [Gekko kuhli]